MQGWEQDFCTECKKILPLPELNRQTKRITRFRYYITADNRRLCGECWANPENFIPPMYRKGTKSNG